MTADTISILATILPDHVISMSGFGGRTSFNPEWGYSSSVQRFISAYRDMDFGWRYVRALVQHRLPFHGAVIEGDDEVLFRAYMFCRDPKRYPSPDVELALALSLGQMRASRVTVEGMLLSQGATVVDVANELKLPAEAILAYERLFFNVIDRKDDTAYLQSIVYPHGRMVEMVEGYFENADLNQLIRRAGYNNGKEDVMYLMGASSSALDAMLQTSNTKQMESLMMTYGYMLARNGGLNQLRTPGVNNARALLTAGKLGGETLDNTPLTQDLSATLKEEMMRYARPVARMVGSQ